MNGNHSHTKSFFCILAMCKFPCASSIFLLSLQFAHGQYAEKALYTRMLATQALNRGGGGKGQMDGGGLGERTPAIKTLFCSFLQSLASAKFVLANTP